MPQSIVLLDGIGKTGSVAESIWRNLSSRNGKEKLYLVHTAGLDVDELVARIPARVDLAVIVAPPEQQYRLLHACEATAIGGALLVSADRREPAAGDISKELAEFQAESMHRLRVMGPQSFGLISPHHDLNITSGQPMPHSGGTAFISQSGALCSAVLDWSFKTSVGFSAMISCEAMVDVDWSDLITHFGDDHLTKSIVVYLETIGDSRSFLSAAREVALNKPIIVLKAGRTAKGAAVAASFSHGDSGTDAVFEAALQRVGVLRVRTISEMFYMANILASQPLPPGPRLAIITNAVGPAIMATDTLLASGGCLAELTPETEKLIQELVQHPSCCGNPVDVLGDADAERYGAVHGVVSKDQQSDGTLVILTPQPKTQPTQTARSLIASTAKSRKPILASWMGGNRVEEGQAMLFKAGIPTFPYPDTPARLFALMWRHAQNLKGIYETPSVIIDESRTPVDADAAKTILNGVRVTGRTGLTEWESKSVLKAYGIPVVETIPAASEKEAVAAADLLGYPVMLKLLSHDLALKNRISAVRGNLRSAEDVQKAYQSVLQSVEATGAVEEFLGVAVERMVTTSGYELLVGSRTDKHFGPYMYFGTGGKMADILQDQALGLPPLTSALAMRMIEQTKVWKALDDGNSTRGQARLSQLQALLVRLSQLIVHHRVIKEIRINPLLATSDSILVLNAKIYLHDADLPEEALPRTAIRPYPAQYTWHEKARGDLDVLVRPVRPEDEPLIVEFHKKLSEETIYRRYFFQHKLSRRTSHERLRRTCFLDFDREIALAALMDHPEDGPCVVGVGRLAKNRDDESAEIAMVVADPYQSHGIGTLLLKHLVDIARLEKIRQIEGTMLPGNIHMQHLFGKMGFAITAGSDDTVVAHRTL